MKLLKAMATVAGLTGVSRVAGFVRDIMTAAILGAGPVADAFFVALKLPNFFRRVTAEGAFSVSFVPLYAEELAQEGRDAADMFAHRAFSIMLWGLSAFTAAALVFMPGVIALLAPGFTDDPQRYELAVAFSRITFPYLLMMSLTSLLGGVMNAHDRFAPFAVAPVLFNLALIGALVFSESFPTAGDAMAWGVLVAGALQFGLLFITARRWINFRVKLVRPQLTPRIKKLFYLMGPGVLGAGVVQINLFADMIIASFLPTGSISYLYYADRLNQLPLSTVGIAVGTALLPMLSRAVAAGDANEARGLFNRALEMVLLLGLPAALALFVIAEPIISVLFQRGAFSAEDARMTAYVLQGYVIGLPAYIAVKVYSTAFWSQQDTLTPVKVSVIVTLSNIALALFLIRFIGVAGIAVATGTVAWLQLYLLGRPLKGNPMTILDERFRFAAPRMILASGLMAAVLPIVARFLEAPLAGSLFVQIMALSALVVSGLVVYSAGIVLTGAVKPADVKAYLKRSKV